MDATPLQRTGLLDSPSEEVFDAFTNLVAKVLRVPVALISLVDLRRQFFKSHFGLGEPLASERETPLSHSFCQHVSAAGEPLIIEDARVHDLVKDNLAVSEIGGVAYAGVPLYDHLQNPLGALCAIDFKPRAWTGEEIDILKTIAKQVNAEFALRAEVQRQGFDLAALREAESVRRFANRADRHDLRTPLNAVLMSISAIPQLGALNLEQEEFLQIALRNSHSLSGMIDQLLDIGNVDERGHEALTRTSCAPFELVSRAIEQVTVLAREKRISLFRSADTLPTICVDADKIVRVLVNLLGNAVKFTPGGGEVTISLKNESLDGVPAMEFSVRDSGIGIAPENLTHVFSEGFKVQADAPTSRSTGLGLTFCKRIVDAHGGRIGVESEPGRGSVFAFAIPTC